MSETPTPRYARYNIRVLLVAMAITAMLAWQASLVRARQALLLRARADGVYVKYAGQPTFIRTLLGDRTVWSIDISPDSKFYDRATELRRAFPEAYINHLGPVMEAVDPPVPVMIDVPPPSPPIRSAWWGF